jgi:Fe-S cluster assembly ATP-binding protein
MNQLKIDPDFVSRNVNEGFSGGEKKRHEILQLELLQPKFGILDETDSGLDIDACRWSPRASTAPTRPMTSASC